MHPRTRSSGVTSGSGSSASTLISRMSRGCGVGEEVAHALPLVLSRLPLADRLDFAAAFFAKRRRGHALTVTPAATVDFLRERIARVRLDPSVDDADPYAAAAVTVVEVLDPSSEVVAVKEILARAVPSTVMLPPLTSSGPQPSARSQPAVRVDGARVIRDPSCGRETAEIGRHVRLSPALC